LPTLISITENLRALRDFKAFPLAPQILAEDCLSILLAPTSFLHLRAFEVQCNKAEVELAPLLVSLLQGRPHLDRLEVLVLEMTQFTDDFESPVPIEVVMEVHRMCPNLRYLPIQLPASAVVKDDKLLLPNIPQLVSLNLPEQYFMEGEEDQTFISDLYPQLQKFSFTCMSSEPFNLDSFKFLEECEIRSSLFPLVERWPATLRRLRILVFNQNQRSIEDVDTFFQNLYYYCPELTHLHMESYRTFFNGPRIEYLIGALPRLQRLVLKLHFFGDTSKQVMIPIRHACLTSLPELVEGFIPVPVWMPKLRDFTFYTADSQKAGGSLSGAYIPELRRWTSHSSTARGELNPLL
jgi:hypothetical protein